MKSNMAPKIIIYFVFLFSVENPVDYNWLLKKDLWPSNALSAGVRMKESDVTQHLHLN